MLSSCYTFAIIFLFLSHLSELFVTYLDLTFLLFELYLKFIHNKKSCQNNIFTKK